MTKEGGSIELAPNITAELNDDNELIGIEILNASALIRDSILESVQPKIHSLGKVQTVWMDNDAIREVFDAAKTTCRALRTKWRTPNLLNLVPA